MRHHLESHFSAKCALLNRLIERGLQELVDSLQDALTLPASLNIWAHIPLWTAELPMADRDRFLEGSILSVPIN